MNERIDLYLPSPGRHGDFTWRHTCFAKLARLKPVYAVAPYVVTIIAPKDTDLGDRAAIRDLVRRLGLTPSCMTIISPISATGRPDRLKISIFRKNNHSNYFPFVALRDRAEACLAEEALSA